MARWVAASFVAVIFWKTVTILRQTVVRPKGCYIVVGTYTEANAGTPPNIYIESKEELLGNGIHVLRLDLNTGHLKNICDHGMNLPNPSFLAAHPSKPVIYAVSESATDGQVSAIELDERNGVFYFRSLGAVSSLGGLPCHLTVDRAGSTLVCSNYLDGSTAVLPIRPDGSLEEGWRLQNQGCSVNKLRQEGPHAHSSALDATQSLLYSVDLGADSIFVRRWPLESASSNIAFHKKVSIAGSGPRHLVLHPGGVVGYVICELSGRLLVLDIKTCEELAVYDVLPSEAPPASVDGTRAWAADLVLSPNGQFLYASARKHDVITCFRLLANGRELQRVSIESVGKTPRSIAVTADSRFLVAAYQHSDMLETFAINPGGKLCCTGSRISVPKPTCVCLWHR